MKLHIVEYDTTIATYPAMPYVPESGDILRFVTVGVDYEVINREFFMADQAELNICVMVRQVHKPLKRKIE